MTDVQKPYEMIVDYVTQKAVPNVGAEENRQTLERILVEEKGFSRDEIEVDRDLSLTIAGEAYRSQIDLVVSMEGQPVMAIKCASGSLSSREREILAASRLFAPGPIPISVVSDGKTAIVLETATGRIFGEGMDTLPDRASMKRILPQMACPPLSETQREREKLIFRTYDVENVNVARKMG